MEVPSPYANADAAINGIVSAVEAPFKDAVHGFLGSLQKSQVSMSAQWVGNGTFQAASPSFTGVAGGLTGVSASYTAMQVDATGFTIAGRHFAFSTLGKGFSWKDSQSASLTAKDLGTLKATVNRLDHEVFGVPGGLDAQNRRNREMSTATADKVATIQVHLTELTKSMKAGASSRHRIGGPRSASNSAELDTIRLAVDKLAKALGS